MRMDAVASEAIAVRRSLRGGSQLQDPCDPSMKSFQLPPEILSEIAFHLVGNMEPRLHNIIRDVMDSVTMESREDLQKLVAAQAGASYESADKLKDLRKSIARLDQRVAEMTEALQPPAEVNIKPKTISLTAEEEALIKSIRGDK